MRLEHAGHAEFKNFVLGEKQFDAVNRDIELRDLFNAEDAFRLEPYHLDAYRAREIDMTRGDHEAAIGRLRPLASSSDDPAYAAALARTLNATGRLVEAEQQRAFAAARDEQLELHHPEAYADHAAEFRRDALSHPARR